MGFGLGIGLGLGLGLGIGLGLGLGGCILTPSLTLPWALLQTPLTR